MKATARNDNLMDISNITSDGLTDPFSPKREKESSELSYIKDLFYILKADSCDERDLKIHLNVIPDLTNSQLLLILGFSYFFSSDLLELKMKDVIIKSGEGSKKRKGNLIRSIRENLEKDSDCAVFGPKSRYMKSILGRSFIFAINKNLYNISQYILTNSDELSISKKSLIRLAKKGNFPVLKALIHKCSISKKKKKISEILSKIYGNYKERILDEIGILGVLSDQKAGFDDLELLEIIHKELKIGISEDLICELIKSKRTDVIELLGEQGIKAINERVLKLAINGEEWKFIFKHLEEFIDDHLVSDPTQGKFENNTLGKALCNSIQNSFENIEAKLYVCEQCLAYLGFEDAENLLNIFTDSLEYLKSSSSSEEVIQKGFLFHNYNPFKICILIIELSKAIGKKYITIQKHSEKLKQEMLNISNIIQRGISSDIEYRSIILDKDLKGREIISIIQELNLFTLLERPETEKVVKTFWSSQYNTSGSFFQASTNYSLLFSYPLESRIDLEQKLRFRTEVSQLEPHWGQFKVWKKSTFLRYMATTGFLLLYCLLCQINLMAFANDIIVATERATKNFAVRGVTIAKLYEEMETNVTLQEEFSQIEYVEGDHQSERRFLDFLFQYNPQLQVVSDHFTDNISRDIETVATCLYISILMFIYLLQFVLERIFAIIEQRHINLLRADIILSLLIIGISIYLYDGYYRSYEYAHKHYYTLFNTFSLDFCFIIKYADFNNGYLEYHVAMMALLWMGVLFSLKISRIIGPLIIIFIAMMKDIVIFLVVFIIQLLIFACIGNILFVAIIDKYDTFMNCLLTLYQASLGEFDYDDFNFYDNNRRTLGKCYLTIFLLLNTILAINLLIAILSTTYAILSARSTPLFLIENIKQRPLYKYSKRYGSLVSSFFPFYLFVPFFAPLLLNKNKKKNNNIILHFEFIPIYIILHALFLVVSLFLLPFTYLKIIIHKIRLIQRGKYKNHTKWVGIVQLFLYIVFGLLVNIIQTLFFDSIKFTKQTYSHHIPILYDSRDLDFLTENKLQIILSHLSKITGESRSSKIEVDAFLRDFRVNCRREGSHSSDYAYVLRLMNLRIVETDSKDINSLTLREILLFDLFVRRNTINNIVYPSLLLELILSSIQFKLLRKLIVGATKSQLIYNEEEYKVRKCPSRVIWILHYSNLTKIMSNMRKEEEEYSILGLTQKKAQ